MKASLRLSILLLVIGLSITVGTVAEGATPHVIIWESAYMLPSGESNFFLANGTLAAKCYLLSLHVQEGSPLNLVFADAGSLLLKTANSVTSLTEYGVVPFRGVYNLKVANNGTSPSLFRLSLILYGLDQQQILAGTIIYAVGFASCLAHALARLATTLKEEE